jgi:hypothetical protein
MTYGPYRPSAAYEAARWANNNRAWIDAEWDALPDVPRTIAGHLAWSVVNPREGDVM